MFARYVMMVAVPFFLVIVTPEITRAQRRVDTSSYFLQEFSWSPDSRSIGVSAFTHGQWDIFVVKFDDGAVTQITNDTNFDVWTSWSPDGKLTYASRHDTLFQLYQWNPETVMTHALTGQTDWLSMPSWSPDGKMLAVCPRHGKQYDVALLNPKSMKLIDLANDSLEEENPIWSPDGSRIVWYGMVSKDNDELYVYDVATRKTTQVTATPYREFYPSWTPDGRGLLYAALTDSTVPRLWAIALDSADAPKRVLPDDPRKVYFGRYSLDGKWLGYLTGNFPSSQLEVIRADGSGRPRVLFGKTTGQ